MKPKTGYHEEEYSETHKKKLLDAENTALGRKLPTALKAKDEKTFRKNKRAERKNRRAKKSRGRSKASTYQQFQKDRQTQWKEGNQARGN